MCVALGDVYRGMASEFLRDFQVSGLIQHIRDEIMAEGMRRDRADRVIAEAFADQIGRASCRERV